MITQQRLFELCHYDPETGLFTGLVNRGRRYKVGMPFGKPEKKGYLQVSIDGTTYHLHRLAWLYVTGELPRFQIDHRNTITGDNRFENLRAADRYKNAQNKRYSLGKSGVRGVSETSEGKWLAQVQANGIKVLCKLFDCLDEADKAAQAARAIHHGDFDRKG